MKTIILVGMPDSRNKDDFLLAECAHFDLLRASRVVSNLYNDHLRDSGITIAQWTLLRNIEALQPVGMTRMAKAMAMDRTSVTRVIAPLVEQGFVTVSAADDRRIRNLKLTAKGAAALRRAVTHWAKAQRQLFGALGDSQWLALRLALRATVRSVKDLEHAEEGKRRPASAA